MNNYLVGNENYPIFGAHQKQIDMSPEAKVLVMNSLSVFKAAGLTKKRNCILGVQELLKEHERALKTIGVGYSARYVVAARVFLRIIKKDIICLEKKGMLN